MKTTLEQVMEFHLRFGHPLHIKPYLTNSTLNDLRVDLLREEVEELKAALGQCDPEAVLDALSDIQYVLDGAYHALGFSLVKEPAFAEVHRSNMSKLGADGKPIVRADGKILKGPNWTPPDLKPILSALCQTNS